jgi:hypothetical protein
LIQILRINASTPVIAAVAGPQAARINAINTGANGWKPRLALRVAPSGFGKIRIR